MKRVDLLIYRDLPRIGYFTTFLVFVELVFVGYVVPHDWLDRRQISADLTEESRTHETSLLPNGDPYVRGSAIRLLAKLPPLNSLQGHDGSDCITSHDDVTRALRAIQNGLDDLLELET